MIVQGPKRLLSDQLQTPAPFTVSFCKHAHPIFAGFLQLEVSEVGAPVLTSHSPFITKSTAVLYIHKPFLLPYQLPLALVM